MNIQFLVLHHTATKGAGDGETEWDTIKRLCQERRGSTYICDYHFGVGPTGKLFIGTAVSAPCWHCGDDFINQSSLAVACIGNFELSPMPEPQKSQLLQLIGELQTQYPKAKIKFHKEIVATLCPGKYFPYQESLNIQLPKHRFSDVPPSHIFYSAINMVVQKKIMNGDKEGTFRPSDPVLRGELAQVFVNFLNRDEP
jgi:hypothetical protein